MDYLSSYTANLLEQSRFYFPPLAAMRNALQDARPPMALAADGSSATAAAAAVTSLAPFVDLGLLHARTGPRGEREIPLDLSMKTIRQTPDSTADDDVVILEHRRTTARHHALQVAAAMAAGKLPFAFGPAAPGASPFLAPPPPPFFSNDHLSPLLTPTSSAAGPASSPAAFRCPQTSDGNSAFLTPPHAGLHAPAVCGGLNGFCLDPHRCRLASLSAAARSGGFQMPSPFSTISSTSAAAAAAAAAVMYERQLAKLIPSSAAGTTPLGGANAAPTAGGDGGGALPGLSELHLPTASSATTVPTSSPSVDVLKPSQFPTAERYLSSFALPTSLGLPVFHHQHHAHPKDVPVPCACCLPKSFPLPCVCCYPSTAPRGFDGPPPPPTTADGMFNCCQPPTLPVVPTSCADPIPVLSAPKSETKDKFKRDALSSSSTTTAPSGGGSGKSCHSSGTKSHHHHHHHHHHGHHHQNGTCKSSGGATVRNKTTSSSSPRPQTPSSCPPSAQAPSGSPSPAKDESRLSTSGRPASPPKRQAEGGRWIPHQHSHKDKAAANKKLASATAVEAPSGAKATKVFAPVVHIQPSPPARPKTTSPPAVPPPPVTWPSDSVTPAPASRTPASPQSSSPIRSQPAEESSPSSVVVSSSSTSAATTPPLKREADTSNDVTSVTNDAMATLRPPSVPGAQWHPSTPPLPPPTQPLHAASPPRQEANHQSPPPPPPLPLLPLPPPALPKPTPLPATIGRWMLSPPIAIKSEAEERVSCSPRRTPPYPLAPWDRSYPPEVATSAVVSPVATSKKPNAAALEHPASPAEGCSPTAAEVKVSEVDSMVMADRTPAPVPDSSYIAALVGVAPPVAALKLHKDDQSWRLPATKRPHCDTMDSLPSKKKQKKQKREFGGFLPLKEEVQTGMLEMQKSGLQRKFEDDSEVLQQQQQPVAPPGDEPPRFAAPTALVPPFFQPVPTDQHLSSPLSHHLGAFQALAAAGGCKPERPDKQQPSSPSRPSAQFHANGDLTGLTSPSKNNSGILFKNGGLLPPGVVAGDDKPNFLDRPELPRLPPVGVTLVKTAHLGINQYKSSILSGVPKMDDTTAMLRLYYEQQKQLLQEGYAQRLLSEAGYKLPAPVPVSLAQFPLAAIPTSTALAAPSMLHHNKPKKFSSSSGKHPHHRHHHHHHHQTATPAPQLQLDGCALLPNGVDDGSGRRHRPSAFYGPEDEDARDGDDEREEDAEERCKRALAAEVKLPSPQDGASYQPMVGSAAEAEAAPKQPLDAAEASGRSSHPVSPAGATVSLPLETTPSTAVSLGSGPSGLMPNGGRSETMKRLMINKALGETMLHRAARLGYLDVISYCLEAQVVAIDARDNAGNTPLHECCSRGHLEIARLLLEHGADPNASATGGIRPLHDSVENDQVEIARLLLSYGADPLLATYSGLTPLKLARSPVMLEFLKGHLADVSGESDTPVMPWQFYGSARFFDPWPTGYDPLGDLPSDDDDCASDVRGQHDDDVDSAAALVFENP